MTKMTKQTQHWDTIARRYVEGSDPTPAETFAPLRWLGDEFAEPKHAANDNKPTPWEEMEAASGRGPYITTYRGRFYPFDPRASEVNIYDIAHSLARICRYTGHGEKTYCVAEHSVHIARWLLPRYGYRAALAGLLHDAPEALSGFGDVARPAKKRAPIIKQTENNIWQAVAAAFGLSPILPDEVHEADSRIIADEMQQNLWEVDPEYTNPLGVTLEFWTPAEAEREFLAQYRELVEERAVAA